MLYCSVLCYTIPNYTPLHDLTTLSVLIGAAGFYILARCCFVFFVSSSVHWKQLTFSVFTLCLLIFLFSRAKNDNNASRCLSFSRAALRRRIICSPALFTDPKKKKNPGSAHEKQSGVLAKVRVFKPSPLTCRAAMC